MFGPHVSSCTLSLFVSDTTSMPGAWLSSFVGTADTAAANKVASVMRVQTGAMMFDVLASRCEKPRYRL